MEFFLPAHQDPRASEKVYKELHSIVEDATGWTLESGRIFAVDYRDGDEDRHAAVGSDLDGKIVNAIFATEMAVIVCRCSSESPCAPLLLKKHDVVRSEWFEGHQPLSDLTCASPEPEGVGTFLLFTDIEGSTRAWEDHPAHMRYALKLHDTIMYNAVNANGGQVFNTAGDSFFCSFQEGGHALRAAVDAQAAIAGVAWPDPLDLKVRMVLHYGESLRWNDGYVGAALNHAANLLAHAEGGQVLVTADVAAKCGTSLAASLQMRPFGHVALGELCEPTTVFELVHPAFQCVGAKNKPYVGLEQAA